MTQTESSPAGKGFWLTGWAMFGAMSVVTLGILDLLPWWTYIPAFLVMMAVMLYHSPNTI